LINFSNSYSILILWPAVSFGISIDNLPLSCLREYGSNWILEFDLPLVNKKDIQVTFNENTIFVEAKLREVYSEEKLGTKTKFEYFKKIITLPGKIDSKNTTAKFNKGRLTIEIPKLIDGHKIKIE